MSEKYDKLQKDFENLMEVHEKTLRLFHTLNNKVGEHSIKIEKLEGMHP